MQALAGRFSPQAVDAHLRQLPPAYLLSTPEEQIADHLLLVAEAAGGTALRHHPVGNMERLALVTPDRPGILSAIAGTLACHSVTVLGGVAYTRDDGVAIEVLHVTDALGLSIDERRWARVAEALPRALAGAFPIDAQLAETRRAYPAPKPADIPTSVHVDNAGSDQYSIVEVRAADRLGLLYAITSALHGLALDIHLAKVDTLGREVVDAFYVRRENGRRITERDEVERIVRRVSDAIAAIDGPPAG
jgi:[protein-PII] uridylyltransferase